MGQDMKNRSRVCPLPPGPLKDLNRQLKPRTMFMAVSLTLILATAGLVWIQPYLVVSPPLQLIPHYPITIDGDTKFSDIALLEGWSGDGSPENPFIIDRLEIVRDNGFVGEGVCIFINNTRVSFIISNCNLSNAFCHMMGTVAAALTLGNVSNGLIVNNIFHGNEVDIILENSHSNTVANNTYYERDVGEEAIIIRNSHSICVVNNTFYGRIDWGTVISIENSHSNTLVNNTSVYYTGNDIIDEFELDVGYSEFLLFYGFLGFMVCTVITLLGEVVIGKHESNGK